MAPRPALILLLASTIGGCVAAPPVPPPAPDPVFSPLAFFAGDTQGQGALKIATRRTRPVQVVGHGTLKPDGTLVLVQRVREGTAPERVRTWRIHGEGDGRYAGSLSDADGPVAIAAQGDRLHIAYRAKGGFHVEQWLVLQPGGRSASNRLVVTKLGLRIAALRETIVRR